MARGVSKERGRLSVTEGQGRCGNTRRDLFFENPRAVFPFWQKLNEQEQNELRTQTTFRKYSNAVYAGICELPMARSLFIVCRGNVHVVVRTEDGKQMCLFTVQKGETCVPIHYLADRMEYSLGMIIEKNTEIYAIPENLHAKLFAQNEGLRNYEITKAGAMMGRFANMVGELTFSVLEERLLKRLREQCLRQNDNTVSITHERLASDLGTSREVVSRLLKKMAADGVVCLQRKRITINLEMRTRPKLHG